jgi:hypothetical protein
MDRAQVTATNNRDPHSSDFLPSGLFTGYVVDVGIAQPHGVP